MAVFTSTYKALSHGALNWDTQLDADMTTLESLFTSTVHADRSAGGTFSGDWNTLTAPGTYSIVATNTNTNAPAGSYLYGVLEVVRAASYIAQVYHDLNTDKWVRSYNASAWTPWRRLAAASEILAKQNGRVTLGGSSADGSKFSATATISLTSGLFTAAPIVMCNAESASPSVDVTMASSISTTGFTIKHVRDVSFASGAVIAWTAEALTP